MKQYKDYVLPYLDDFVKIEIGKAKIKQIEEFVREIIHHKSQEEHHMRDGFNEFKRFYTGMLGEAAIESLLGIEIIDWSIGCSNTFHVADLGAAGYNVGVKTVEYGKFPVINTIVKRSEFINIKKNNNTVYVCGLATVRALKAYQDSQLILSPSLQARGTKTGFYGFSDLVRVTNSGVLKVVLGQKAM